jgi:hypothetical protein
VNGVRLNAKAEVMRFRCDREERTRFEAAARRRGKTFSDWAREALSLVERMETEHAATDIPAALPESPARLGAANHKHLQDLSDLLEWWRQKKAVRRLKSSR